MNFGNEIDGIVRLTKWILTHAPEHREHIGTQDYTIFYVALDVLEAQRCRLNMLQQSFDALTEHKKEKK